MDREPEAPERALPQTTPASEQDTWTRPGVPVSSAHELMKHTAENGWSGPLGPCGQGTAKRLVWLEEDHEEPNAGQDSGGLYPKREGVLDSRERYKRRLPTAQAATEECGSGHPECWWIYS